jgi:hypothetical protein
VALWHLVLLALSMRRLVRHAPGQSWLALRAAVLRLAVSSGALLGTAALVFRFVVRPLRLAAGDPGLIVRHALRPATA